MTPDSERLGHFAALSIAGAPIHPVSGANSKHSKALSIAVLQYFELTMGKMRERGTRDEVLRRNYMAVVSTAPQVTVHCCSAVSEQ